MVSRAGAALQHPHSLPCLPATHLVCLPAAAPHCRGPAPRHLCGSIASEGWLLRVTACRRMQRRVRASVFPCSAAAPSHRPSLRAGATLGSFLIALLHFVMELCLFQTMSLKFALQPMIVAGGSCRAAARGPCSTTHAASRPHCLPATRVGPSLGEAGVGAPMAVHPPPPIAVDLLAIQSSVPPPHAAAPALAPQPVACCPRWACACESLRPRLDRPCPAGISSLWMALGWNYYTAYARPEPTMSEDITVTQKDE